MCACAPVFVFCVSVASVMGNKGPNAGSACACVCVCVCARARARAAL